MANFARVPGGQSLSGQALTVSGTSTTVGVWGPLEPNGRELDVQSDNARFSCTKAAMAGNVRQWTITGPNGQTGTLRIIASDGGAWDTLSLTFRSGGPAGGDISVTAITADVLGSEGADHTVTVNIPPINIVDVSTFRAGASSNAPQFLRTGPTTAELGFFACHKGNSTRAAVLLVPEGATPDRVLVGITHGFGQNAAYYGGLGWNDPLSPRLLNDVASRFVINRWGPQMLASRKSMAMVIPVRASSGGGGELGPFAHDGDFLKQVLLSMSALTNGAFTPGHVEFFTFSSGIYELGGVVNAAAGQLPVDAIYTLDPAHATVAPHPGAAVRRQFLSGQTGAAKAGFEYMPVTRWANDPTPWNGRSNDLFGYLHNHTMPDYCLYLGIQTS